MSDNPIWRESLEIYFNEGHGFAVYFYLLVIIAPVEFLSLYIPSLDAQMWSGSASLFKVTAVTTVVLIIYFSLRVANQEFAPWRFKSLKTWVREQGMSVALIRRGQLSFLCAHAGLSLLLCAPLLVWAGAIARTAPVSMALTFLLLPFYSLCYGVWGLATLALWERRLENRQVFIRSLFTAMVILSALFYLPLNPIAFLLALLGSQELPPLLLFGVRFSGATAHLTFHLLLGAGGYALYSWALQREPGL